MNKVFALLRTLLATIPFLLFLFFDIKANLKKPLRSRQILMPALALVYCVVLVLLNAKLGELCISLLQLLPRLLESLSRWLSGVLGGKLTVIADVLRRLADSIAGLTRKLDLRYLTMILFNALGMLVHVILKRILIAIMRGAFKTGNPLYEKAAGLFYEHDPEQEQWYVRKRFRDVRTYLRCFFGASIVISVLMMLLSVWLYREGLLNAFFYPIYGIIIIGECCFALGGETREEAEGDHSAESERSRSIVNYVLLRGALRRLFGDKLTAEDSSPSFDVETGIGVDTLLSEMEKRGDTAAATYALYMRKRIETGEELDENYLGTGLELLDGKSILFNNPFYYDLIPYAFFAMNRTLLRHKKALIILGRHGTEQDLHAWCREGLRSISGIPDLWRIGELTGTEQELDVGIVTRSSVHDEAVHEANRAFLEKVEYVVLIEPSRLVTTAQVGLNNLIRCCRRGGNAITYCSTDKNCDGLVDALSHILMCSIGEVSATNRHKGVCSYMSWAPDREHLQHRMLPNISRYFGMGTELSFAALKQQVTQTKWYGGDAFPVTDMHWIVKQYYYDLLHYAGLPTSQEMIDKCFVVSPNNWDERCRASNYLTVEDESFNMFEAKRNYATRASEQSFINILSSNYLLRDYMADNDSIFNADPKAIPYIVADYARTPRNVALRLCLKMSTRYLEESELLRELMLVDVDTSDPIQGLWTLLCAACSPISNRKEDGILRCISDGKELYFNSSEIRMQRKYSVRSGNMENQYYIPDAAFARALLNDLRSARYIAEEEDAEGRFLGTELRGHIFQKYLPGQFFTFNGKYYEMLSVTNDGQVLVRRAADHINGRPTYRQVRRYVLCAVKDAENMGACRSFGGMRITQQYADMRVETSAYWELDDYNDFAHGRKVTVSGIPDRSFSNKQILRIDFPDAAERFTPEIRKTITLLINEVFRTLFAENQCYIVAAGADPADAPLTCEVAGENGFVPEENAVYIIEDSQLDIGLLVAAERNIRRILAIIFDYLDWHLETLEKSINPPPPPPPRAEEEPETTEPKGFFGKMRKRLGCFFGGIGSALKKLFHKKNASGEAEGAAAGGDDEKAEKRSKRKAEKAERQRRRAEQKARKQAKEAAAAENAVSSSDTENSENIESAIPQPLDAAADAQDTAVEVLDETDDAPAEADSLPVEVNDAPAEADDAPKETETDSAPLLMSVLRRSDAVPEDGTPAPEAEPTEEQPTDANVEFEAEHLAVSPNAPERKTYHLRYYLLYGGDELPDGLALEDTMEFLRGFGLENGELKQARDGKSIADLIEKTYRPNQSGQHYCDFCGAELGGVEYDLLADGRERCPVCSRTAIRTAEEFERLYQSVVKNLESFYGARITVPVHVQMINAKRLHRRIGKSFVPTGKHDGRTLGVAIKDKKGYSILLENGAPRMASAMTIAHELTHIWQYLNWNAKEIKKKYGTRELQIYEGMAKWAEIQYAFLVGEPGMGKREEMNTRLRSDEYGVGFRQFAEKYPLSYGTRLEGNSPFNQGNEPI